MKECELQEYSDLFDKLSRNFEENYIRFRKMKYDQRKLKSGDDVYLILGCAMYATSEFYRTLEKFEQSRIAFWVPSRIRKTRGDILKHSQRDLQYMTASLRLVDQSLRNAAWETHTKLLVRTRTNANN